MRIVLRELVITVTAVYLTHPLAGGLRFSLVPAAAVVTGWFQRWRVSLVWLVCSTSLRWADRRNRTSFSLPSSWLFLSFWRMGRGNETRKYYQVSADVCTKYWVADRISCQQFYFFLSALADCVWFDLWETFMPDTVTQNCHQPKTNFLR